MPRYDLECVNAHRFEVQRGMNQPNPPCPICGSPEVAQLPPVRTSFVLRGSGWAATSYVKEERDDF